MKSPQAWLGRWAVAVLVVTALRLADAACVCNTSPCSAQAKTLECASSDDLADLSPSLENLSALRVITIGEGSLVTFPAAIYGLTQVTSLSQLLIQGLEASQICENSFLAPNKHQRLEISQRTIPTVPNAISTLSRLTSLDLAVNRLTSLPNAIGQLSSLVLFGLGGVLGGLGGILDSGDEVDATAENVGSLKILYVWTFKTIGNLTLLREANLYDLYVDTRFDCTESGDGDGTDGGDGSDGGDGGDDGDDSTGGEDNDSGGDDNSGTDDNDSSNDDDETVEFPLYPVVGGAAGGVALLGVSIAGTVWFRRRRHGAAASRPSGDAGFYGQEAQPVSGTLLLPAKNVAIADAQPWYPPAIAVALALDDEEMEEEEDDNDADDRVDANAEDRN
ncbi:Leucine rich repeat / protein phosphatase 2C domain containing protein [Hondaea fermentalgiana]|uniref:Leucine rich repeat / protein phosphatase 2C domain containing protein n=1 Tax=Hondaea fermentalgiana TaxID=2315210 RepID=A0A2R5G8T8_9STRA|nr:Leucine rich repeat / protein phosphatase 2C domain containing protein [Hondaea fermentalgiana]|eukprot:GBG26749.1 Leucine rich repeat / protein phosphatase 2C domain containing protein [Hondaea fermentalgiana]